MVSRTDDLSSHGQSAFGMVENKCYDCSARAIYDEIGDPKSGYYESKKIVNDNPKKYVSQYCLITIVIITAVIVATLIVGVLSSCINFSLEIDELKSVAHNSPNWSSIQQLDSTLSLINASLETFHQGVSNNQLLTDNRIQQLNSVLDSALALIQNFNASVENFHLGVSQNQQSTDIMIQELNSVLLEVIEAIALPSCSALPNTFLSGYYWVRTNQNSSAVRVYCDTTGDCANKTGNGWMRVANLDLSDPNQECPSELNPQNNSNIRTCIRPTVNGGQTSIYFSSNGQTYSKVCGKVIAYQSGYINAFRPYYSSGGSVGLDGYFVDGVVLTHGDVPRKHIWTFAGTRDELVTHSWSGCTCLRPTSFVPPPPFFIGNDYFCDAGSRDHYEFIFYTDPLWDGAGCESPRSTEFNNTCCSFNNPPWFYKQLPQPTADPVEMRLCQSSTAIQLHSYEIYVH